MQPDRGFYLFGEDVESSSTIQVLKKATQGGSSNDAKFGEYLLKDTWHESEARAPGDASSTKWWERLVCLASYAFFPPPCLDQPEVGHAPNDPFPERDYSHNASLLFPRGNKMFYLPQVCAFPGSRVAFCSCSVMGLQNHSHHLHCTAIISHFISLTSKPWFSLGGSRYARKVGPSPSRDPYGISETSFFFLFSLFLFHYSGRNMTFLLHSSATSMLNTITYCNPFASFPSIS